VPERTNYIISFSLGKTTDLISDGLEAGLLVRYPGLSGMFAVVGNNVNTFI